MSHSRIRSGLTFGIGMSVFFIIQHLLINDQQTPYHIIRAILTGLATGALSGLLFGWIIALFSRSAFVAQSTRIETGPGESIVFESPANHFKRIEGVGGRLYLTNKRLIFKSHKLNFQNHQLVIELTDIKEVSRYKTLGMVNNGLAITTANNKTEKFVVEEIETWVNHLSGEIRIAV